MTDLEYEERVRSQVRLRYGEAARQRSGSCCCGPADGGSSCCGGGDVNAAVKLGYSLDEVAAVPDGAEMSLGCGNPGAIAALQPGEVVLDLGSGGGFDCFLAARRVGETGRVIGVDMTPEMLSRARANAAAGGFANVEFRLGEIEHLPVADGEVDVIISNCVINLSPDKRAVLSEAYRALRPGGRLAISDIVATAPLPESVRQDPALWSACISGATSINELAALLDDAGFMSIRIAPKDESRDLIREWAPGSRAEEYIVSAMIEAVKPAT